MPRLTRKTSKMSGLPPGTLVHIGEKRSEKIKITIIDYDEKQFQEKEAKTIEECLPFKEKPTVTWINIDGLHQTDMIEKIGNHFNIHPLVLEDIVNTTQRPKIEDFDNYIYIILKMLSHNEKENKTDAEQVSLILGQNFVISFQEKEGDIFGPVRERIRKGKGRIRKAGADYLAYSLMDAVVDGYFTIIEKSGEKIEMLEESVIANPTPQTLQIIHGLKGEMIFLRKSIWPLREVISGLSRGGSTLINDTTIIYLHDVYDHTIQVIDAIETSRDMLTGMLDIYLSSISNRMNEVSNKMNEVMKVLTIIATIFIPLTFVAGVYGMNFKYMPELEWPLGYPMVLLIMAMIGLIMIKYFKKKKWL
ncbi:magnesium/cobalt transporter CorA [Candidatus Margulisiibacteriota bacterium]